MAISKITLNGTTLMDATTATAAAGDITAPKTAMLADGVVTTGTGTGGGGGGGETTFTGGDAQDITISIGTKMAQRDFYLKITAQTGTEFTYDTYYKFADIIWLCLSGIAHYDLSTNGTKKTAISDLSYTVNNDGTITTSAVGDNVSVGSNIRNTSTTKNGSANQYKITKDNNGFSLYLGNSNASYRFPSTVTYAYEIVYFGSNAATDIVEVA